MASFNTTTGVLEHQLKSFFLGAGHPALWPEDFLGLNAGRSTEHGYRWCP